MTTVRCHKMCVLTACGLHTRGGSRKPTITRHFYVCNQLMYQNKTTKNKKVDKWRKVFLSSMFCGFSSFIVLTLSFVNYHSFSLGDKENSNAA